MRTLPESHQLISRRMAESDKLFKKKSMHNYFSKKNLSILFLF